jgi:hypothetical protein
MRSLERTRRGPYAGLAARLTALFVATALATPAVAAPADDPAIAEATRIYQQGIGERDAGNHVAAAESFTDAYDKIPPASREIRAAVLFDLVDARRNAFAEGEGAAQLCECERRLVAYSDEVTDTFGAKGERFPDTRKARKLLADVRAQIAGLRAETPDLDCSALGVDKAPPPAPEPIAEAPPPKPPEPPGPDPVVHKQRRDQTLAGGVLVGVGGVFLVVMAAGLGVGRKAERDGTDLTDAATAAGMPLSMDDPSLQDPVRRGKIGNGLAIAGGVIGGVALVTGVTLLVLGKRPVPPRRASLRPALAPGFAGAALHLRF